MTDLQVQEVSGGLELRYVPLRDAVRWDRNPKKHDIGALVRSIELHGFRDPPAFDSALGAFVEGNGRTEALQWMFDQQYPVPRGIGLVLSTPSSDPDEKPTIVDWAMPVLFGVDATSRLAAEAYGVDHNNLVLAGGDFTAIDYAKNWDSSYVELVRELVEQQQTMSSVDPDDVDALLRYASGAAAGGSSILLDYNTDSGTGFAEGEQFSTSYAAVIPLSDAQANDPEFKLLLQGFCTEHGLTYKIGKR